SHSVALASLNASSESGAIDIGAPADQVAAPPPGGAEGPLLVLSDNTVRPVDPTTHELGAPVTIGPGPHSVTVARGGAMLSPGVYIANAGDGTISVLDQKATTVQSTLNVGGQPVGVARTIDGSLWVADGTSGKVSMFDATGGRLLQAVAVGPQLSGLAATPDGHYLVLASSDPDAALYTVDLLANALGGAD